MRVERLLAPAFLAVALAGCVDSPADVDGGDGRLVFTTEFSFAGNAAVGLPIEVVRLTPRFFPEGGPAGDAQRVNVDPDDEQFRVDARVDLGGEDSAQLEVLVELISTASGEEVVEWSGMVGPVLVVADEDTPIQQSVALIRGPIENQLVDSLIAFGPSLMTLGASHPAHAVVFTSGDSHTVIWSSSDESIVSIAPVEGDSVSLFAQDSGHVWIHAGAGAHSDSFQVFVTSFESGPAAFVFVNPDSAVMVPGATRTWQAFALDSLGFPVFPTFTWTSLDNSIASVSAAGVVTAHTLGLARIVATADGISDTAIVSVENLPPGVTIMWQGGTFPAEHDWFTADNWSPARVPTPTDIVYIPTGSRFLELTANTEIGGLRADSGAAYSFDIGDNTLTIHGDLTAPLIFADSSGRVIMDGADAELWSFFLPQLTITGHVTLVGDVAIYQGGDLVIDGTGDGASLNVTDRYFAFAEGDLRVINATLHIAEEDTSFSEGGIFVFGDALFDGGNNTTTLTGGEIGVGGDFTVTAASCTAFSPVGTGVQLISDTAVINIGCSNTEAAGNRFWDLQVYQESFVDRVVELRSDVYVLNETYLDGGSGTFVRGAGHTLYLNYGNAYTTTFDQTFVEIVIPEPAHSFYLDDIVFTGMSGVTRPQLSYTHPGICATSCYDGVDVAFDVSSSGPYIRLVDPIANGDSVILYMEQNPGDGPARTEVSGEAAVYWADVAVHMFHFSGSGQTGPQNQPLPDSLVADVRDYAFNAVSGATVNWTVTVGNGSVSPTSSVTGEDGLATTQFTLGDTTFTFQEVIATSPALPGDTLHFAAFPTPAPPAGVAPRQPSEGRLVPVRRNEPAAERARPEWPELPARPVREGGFR